MSAPCTQPAPPSNQDSTSLVCSDRSFILTQETETSEEHMKDEKDNEDDEDDEDDDEKAEEDKNSEEETNSNSHALLAKPTDAQPRSRNSSNQPRHPYVSPFKSPDKSDRKICPYCFNSPCNAVKYGQFCAYLCMTGYNGKCEDEKEDLISKYHAAYHAAHEWDKLLQSGTKAKPIDPDDILDLPDCVVGFCNTWLRQLKEREDAKAKAKLNKLN